MSGWTKAERDHQIERLKLLGFEAIEWYRGPGLIPETAWLEERYMLKLKIPGGWQVLCTTDEVNQLLKNTADVAGPEWEERTLIITVTGRFSKGIRVSRKEAAQWMTGNRDALLAELETAEVDTDEYEAYGVSDIEVTEESTWIDITDDRPLGQ